MKTTTGERVGCLLHGITLKLIFLYSVFPLQSRASSEPCILQAKVTKSGSVAIVHNPALSDNSPYVTDVNVGKDNPNYFSVAWDNNHYPVHDGSSCGTQKCVDHGTDCLCDIVLTESSVFAALPTRDEIIDKLKVGGFDVSILDGYTLHRDSTEEIQVYQKGSEYNKDTLFKTDHLGKSVLFKNIEFNVNIDDFSFRNPVQFLNPALREARDASYETDAVIGHYVQHHNTPPFLAKRMIQRFGISNPSPDFIKDVASAFKSGRFVNGDISFGDSRYGNMEAMTASIILHEESRNVLLDADPTSGSLREPVLKYIGLLKSLEFSNAPYAPEIRLNNLQVKIGQEAHETPNVFSFFLPEFASPGMINLMTFNA